MKGLVTWTLAVVTQGYLSIKIKMDIDSVLTFLYENDTTL